MAISALEQIEAAASGEALLEEVEAAIADANRNMRAHARAESRGVMGTTLVALLMFGGHFACVWCGDSRAYLLARRRVASAHARPFRDAGLG